MLGMGRYNRQVHKAWAVLVDPALLDAFGIDCDISDLPPYSSQGARQPRVQMQIDDELDVCMDAFTYLRAFIGHRCASLAHRDHAYPGLLAPLTREDSASQQLGLAVAARTWRVIALAEKEALSNWSLARLLHRVAFVNSTLVRVFACSGAMASEMLTATIQRFSRFARQRLGSELCHRERLQQVQGSPA